MIDTSEETRTQFARRLPYIRTVLGWTICDVASMLDLTRVTVCRVETGESKMTKVYYLALAKIIDEDLKDKSEFLKQLVRWIIDAPDDSIIFSEIDRLADFRGRRIRKTELSRYVVTCIHDEILRGKELIKNG